MDAPLTIAHLQTEEAELIFDRFDESTAWALGGILVAHAQAQNLPVVINIRSADRTLFHAAVSGATPLNDIWARRKSNVTLKFHLSSMLVGLTKAARGQTVAHDGLSADEFAIHGGSVPIRVAGVGVVAAATVSGLPQEDDHRLVIFGIKKLLNI